MIHIYTQKSGENRILQNDLYFNLYTGNQPFTEEDKKIIQEIDHAKLTDDLHIETEYGLVKNPDKIVCTDECGSLAGMFHCLYCTGGGQ